jgi:hypothetical protein
MRTYLTSLHGATILISNLRATIYFPLITMQSTQPSVSLQGTM